jgi:hypothetical protein
MVRSAPLFVVRAYWLDDCHSPRTPKLTLREAVLDWIYTLEGLGEVIDNLFQEIAFGSDRATAIVLAAFVEDHLTHFIRSRLVKDDRLQQKMLGPGGACGDFGTKINLAYLFGFYSAPGWKELDTIRRIRNDFAHNLRINRFGTASIKDRCANLSLWQKLKIELHVDEPGSDDKIKIDESIDPSDPKQRYVNACRYYILMFTLAVRNGKEAPMPLF